MRFRRSIHKDSIFVFIQNENGDKYEFKYGVLIPELEEIKPGNSYFINHLPGRKSDVRDIVGIAEYSLKDGKRPKENYKNRGRPDFLRVFGEEGNSNII